ncbi:hypothetical protein HPB51_013212 [Rhipicephalus microplus]|uniref:Helicase C-terminal domain-containing protein n=1 Tax=Rhipicephalus microplus TaxID=6941 RepID=A0A9J6DMY9_RHIMP|nr:hypothetical protein HPB51_013212 [Rhipicephalus microplus]
MDIDRVDIVFNYDMPEDSDTYLHRVARAGRFGTKGLALTFVAGEQDANTLNQVQDRASPQKSFCECGSGDVVYQSPDLITSKCGMSGQVDIAAVATVLRSKSSGDSGLDGCYHETRVISGSLSPTVPGKVCRDGTGIDVMKGQAWFLWCR